MTTQRAGASVLLLWEQLINELMSRTESFPKRVRMSVSQRLEVLVLDVYEQLVIARYSKAPGTVLQQVNLGLEKLRLLLRICYQRRFLSEQGLRGMIEKIDEVGRIIGGWYKKSSGT